jgi:hypothetical protein
MTSNVEPRNGHADLGGGKIDWGIHQNNPNQVDSSEARRLVNESVVNISSGIRDLARDSWVIAGIALNLIIGLVYVLPLVDGIHMEG